MAEIINQLLQAVISMALAIIGVNYAPEEAKEDSRERLVEAVALAGPGVDAVSGARWGFYELSGECDAEPLDVYEGLPVFIGQTGYSS